MLTWLELMSICLPDALEATRGFLRTFERLSISESIADEALRLLQRPGLSSSRALTWASANVNQLIHVTADPAHVAKADRNVTLPYRWNTGGALFPEASR